MKKIMFAFSVAFVLSLGSCMPEAVGTYALKEGDCQQTLVIKDLARGKYNIILKENDAQEEIVGIRKENVISSKLGSDSVHFVMNGSTVILLYRDKVCVFRKK